MLGVVEHWVWSPDTPSLATLTQCKLRPDCPAAGTGLGTSLSQCSGCFPRLPSFPPWRAASVSVFTNVESEARKGNSLAEALPPLCEHVPTLAPLPWHFYLFLTW